MKKTQQYLQRAGTTHPMKGKAAGANDIRMYTWDLIDNCRLDKCECYSVCDFPKTTNMVKADGSPKKCRVMYWYMKGAAEVLFADIDQMNQYMVWRIGMRLLPMYRSLCKLQIAEAGLSSAVYINTRGDISVNQIHKTICSVQESIDRIEARLVRAKGSKIPGGGISPVLPFERPTFLPGKQRKKKKA